MENKNKLKKIKSYSLRQNKLKQRYLKRKEYLANELRKMNDAQSALYEYNNCKRGIHILVGAVTLVAVFFATQRCLHLETVYSILLSLGVSTISAAGTHNVIEHKKEKIKQEHPDIDFENSNYDEIEKRRCKLFAAQYENDQKIICIDDMNKKCEYCVNEIINSGNTEVLKTCTILNEKKECKKEVPKETSKEKQKIYTMTIE